MHDGKWFERLRETVREHEKERAQNESSIPRYDLEGTPKQGGMGSVFRAWDRQLGRQVAVKFLSERLSETSQAKSRFQREAELAARLDHPNIVRVYDAGTWPDPEKPFIVMQYVEGASLDQAEIQDLRKLVRIVAQAARALHYAHEQGIVHRDLKPQNILLDREGHVFVTDFGLARGVSPREGSSSLPGEVLGTPLYMPPEQALGKLEEVDARSDVYSLGATLYTLASGKPPMEGATAEEVRVNVVTQVPVPLRKHRPDCSEPLERIVRKAMAKEKKERFASAAEFAGALESWLDGSLPRRSAFRRIAAVLAVVAILLGTGGWFLAGRPSTDLPGGDELKLTLIGDCIESGTINSITKAKELISQLEKSPGTRDSRLLALKQKLQARISELLDKDYQLLVVCLATHDERSAGDIRERMRRLDPSEAPRLIESAQMTARRILSLTESIIEHLQKRALPKVKQSIDDLKGIDIPEHLLRPVRKSVVLAAAHEIRGWLSAPGEAPLEKIYQALDDLSGLVPGDAEVVAIANGIRVDACRLLSDREGITKAELDALYRRIIAIDPSCPEAEAIRKKCELHQIREREAQGKWGEALAAFGARDRNGLDLASLALVDAARLLKTPESLKRCDQLEVAKNWLTRLDALEALSSDAPEIYRKRLDELGKDNLPEDFQKAAAGILDRLKAESVRSQALSLSRSVREACSSWDVAKAKASFQKLENLSGLMAEQQASLARVLIQDIEDAEQNAVACQSFLSRKKLEDARQSFESLRRRPVKHPLANRLHSQLLLEFAELGDQKYFLDGYAELGRDYLTDRGERARLAGALVRIADRADKPAEVWKLALLPLDAARKTQSEDVPTLLERGSVLRRLRQYDLAIQDVQKANALSPSPEGSQLLGELLYLKDDLSLALNEFTALGRSAPRKSSSIYWRGVVETRLSLRKEAIADLEEALRLGQGGATIHQLLALNYVESKMWKEALVQAEQSIAAKDRFNEEDRISRSAEEVSLPRAKAEFECDAHLTHANALFGLERYKNCLAECEQVIKLEPRSAAAYFLSGYTKVMMASYQEAIPDLELARELTPENAKRVQDAERLLEKCRKELGK